MEKTVKQIGYLIVGLAALSFTDGQEGTIPMKSVRLMQDSYPTEQQIHDAVNGGSYWTEDVAAAVVRIDTLYELGARERGQEAKLVCLQPCNIPHVLNVLSWGYPECAVSVWDLPEETLSKYGL